MNFKEEPIYVKNWEDLRTKVPRESETHILVIGEYNAWLEVKEKYKKEFKRGCGVPFLDRFPHINHYFSTHTFYGSTHAESTLIAQKCGFNIVFANWDELEGY